MKRFCRLTLAFSKKLAELEAVAAMHIPNYKFCWRMQESDGHRTGRKRLPLGMQAGIIDSL